MKRKTDNFSKFYTKKNNAAIKESFRQEKKAAKKERKEAIERHFEEKRKLRAQQEQQAQRPTKTLKLASKGEGSQAPISGEQLPLNKYIAHSGICSRRDAAELIKQGKVTVNGK